MHMYIRFLVDSFFPSGQQCDVTKAHTPPPRGVLRIDTIFVPDTHTNPTTREHSHENTNTHKHTYT